MSPNNNIPYNDLLEQTKQTDKQGASYRSVVIEPHRGWGSLELDEIWKYRSLLATLISRDIKSRYRKTALGPLWFLIGPLVNTVILSFIFGQMVQLDSSGLPYPIFLYVATLPWSFFSIVVTKSTGSLNEFMGWITKIYIPHLLAPAVSVASGLVDWSIQVIILVGLMMYYHVEITSRIITLPFFLLIALIMGLAVGLWSASLAVRFRDVGSVIGYGINALYYFTPVIYSSDTIPARWLWLYQANPMYWVIEGFRWALLGKGHAPEWMMLFSVGFFTILMITGLFCFKATSRNIVDVR